MGVHRNPQHSGAAVKFPPFLLERYFAQHEFSVPHLLCVSDCQTMTAGELLDLEPGSREALERLPLGYTEAPGGAGLRAEISGLYENLPPDNVLVHVGAEEAIFTFATACLEPGDEVIVHTPCYQSLHQIAASRGCTVIPWVARPENGWAPDTDELARLVTPRTKAIVVNSPHNPTGFCLDRAAMERIVAVAARQGCLLFSDEVYRFLEYGVDEPPRPACDLYERAVSLGVMSKSLGLAGLRVGWVASRDKAALSAMAAVKDYTSICGSAPSEFLAALALRRREVILARQYALTTANLELLEAFMSRHAHLFDWVRPSGGPIAFPRLASGQDAEPFCAEVLSGSGVLLLPGRLYGDAWKAHMRLGFGRADFAQGLGALEDFLKKGAV
ncbi:aminotransferase class I/II-fold pyridoxal phosphate-dependent enzyme [Fundidesulfovibrio putealis]|uniref:aminotransferase class I/II-fold pyridoxal phosphate-dependent enzyme n=1 Tax=Fundidesulfovibrio putealis TaxID=270496 RepID=UPI0004170E9F|nr:aminotransferase class I/II-fold pyridoxal phosphate-dependent enzyme [Fundidesulfovibrio putealis]